MAEIHPTIKIEYRLVPGFSAYCVGTDGSVWSSWRKFGNRGKRRVSGKWVKLTPFRERNGYCRLCLYREDGTRKRFSLHQLILYTFQGPRSRGKISRHLNDVRSDNRLENLMYGTHADNAADCKRNGNISCGEKRYNAKLTDIKVKQIKELRATHTFAAIAELMKTSKSVITSVVAGKTWKHVK